MWYLAICLDCTPVLTQPFSDPRERAGWFTAHKNATGHRVVVRDQEVAGEPS